MYISMYSEYRTFSDELHDSVFFSFVLSSFQRGSIYIYIDTIIYVDLYHVGGANIVLRDTIVILLFVLVLLVVVLNLNVFQGIFFCFALYDRNFYRFHCFFYLLRA